MSWCESSASKHPVTEPHFGEKEQPVCNGANASGYFILRQRFENLRSIIHTCVSGLLCVCVCVCVCACARANFPPLLCIPPLFYPKRLSEHASGTQWLNRNFVVWKPCEFTFQLVLRFTDSWLDLFVLWFIIHWHIWLCSSNCSMQHQRLHLMECKWINKSRWLGHLNVWHLLMRQLREQRTNTQPAQHWLIPTPHNNTNYPPSHLLCRKTLMLQMNIYV